MSFRAPASGRCLACSLTRRWPPAKPWKSHQPGRFVDIPGSAVAMQPGSMAVAADGYLYLNDINGKLMRLNTATGNVTALPATPGGLNHNVGWAYGIGIDSAGQAHIAAQGALHRINADGTLTNVGPMEQSGPMAFAPDGTIYVIPAGDNRVYARRPSGQFDLIAGSETAGFAGDGGPALNALFNGPEGITSPPLTAIVYVSDSGNHRIRVISTSTGVITTFAGTAHNWSSHQRSSCRASKHRGVIRAHLRSLGKSIRRCSKPLSPAAHRGRLNARLHHCRHWSRRDDGKRRPGNLRHDRLASLPRDGFGGQPVLLGLQQLSLHPQNRSGHGHRHASRWLSELHVLRRRQHTGQPALPDESVGHRGRYRRKPGCRGLGGTVAQDPGGHAPDVDVQVVLTEFNHCR